MSTADDLVTLDRAASTAARSLLLPAELRGGLAAASRLVAELVAQVEALNQDVAMLEVQAQELREAHRPPCEGCAGCGRAQPVKFADVPM